LHHAETFTLRELRDDELQEVSGGVASTPNEKKRVTKMSHAPMKVEVG
jgi:bacteriocin-like protein